MFIRIEQFSFRPGTEEKGIPLLREHAAFIATSRGCARGYLASPIHGTSFMVYSEWASETDLDRMEGILRSNPSASGAFFGLMGLLRTPPHVARFQVIE